MRLGAFRHHSQSIHNVHAPTLQSWHWGEKRYIAQYYADLAKKEKEEVKERQAELQSKFEALEAELLKK